MATNRTDYSTFKIESSKRTEIIDAETSARRIYKAERNEVIENESGKVVLYGSKDNTNWDVLAQTDIKSED